MGLSPTVASLLEDRFCALDPAGGGRRGVSAKKGSMGKGGKGMVCMKTTSSPSNRYIDFQVLIFDIQKPMV